MVMANRKEKSPDEINVGQDTIKAQDAMKILAMKFDNDLSWITRITEIIQKSKRMISGLRIE